MYDKEIYNGKLSEIRRMYFNDEITLSVMRGLLHSMGMRGQELEAEVNLIQMEKRES